jgi:hypothetical protein
MAVPKAPRTTTKRKKKINVWKLLKRNVYRGEISE